MSDRSEDFGLRFLDQVMFTQEVSFAPKFASDLRRCFRFNSGGRRIWTPVHGKHERVDTDCVGACRDHCRGYNERGS